MSTPRMVRHDVCRHNYAVERGLVVGFCAQPHHCYWPYYPTVRFPSPSSHMVSDELFPDRSRPMSCWLAQTGSRPITCLWLWPGRWLGMTVPVSTTSASICPDDCRCQVFSTVVQRPCCVVARKLFRHDNYGRDRWKLCGRWFSPRARRCCLRTSLPVPQVQQHETGAERRRRWRSTVSCCRACLPLRVSLFCRQSPFCVNRFTFCIFSQPQSWLSTPLDTCSECLTMLVENYIACNSSRSKT